MCPAGLQYLASPSHQELVHSSHFPPSPPSNQSISTSSVHVVLLLLFILAATPPRRRRRRHRRLLRRRRRKKKKKERKSGRENEVSRGDGGLEDSGARSRKNCIRSSHIREPHRVLRNQLNEESLLLFGEGGREGEREREREGPKKRGGESAKGTGRIDKG